MIIKPYSTPYGTVDFTIPEFLKPGDVAISASGGADSALLLFLLLSNNVIPTVVFMNNANSQYEALVNIISWMNRRFNVDLKLLRWDRTLDTGNHLSPEIILISNKFKYLYTGVTKNADVDFGPAAVRPNRPKASKVWRNRMHMPFIALDKRVVVWLYKELGIIDLFDITYSCATNLKSPCGICYNCKEREWAKTEVKLT